jgi:hypothetical protein
VHLSKRKLFHEKLTVGMILGSKHFTLEDESVKNVFRAVGLGCATNAAWMTIKNRQALLPVENGFA